MGEAIAVVLPLGVGVAISPLPIIAVVLMLATPRARATGPAFLVGWIAGLVVVGAVVVLFAGGVGAGHEDGPAVWISTLNGILGMLLVLLALRMWRQRPKGDDEPALPSWMTTLDTFTAVRALGMGALLSGVNPKNLMLSISAGTAIAQSTEDPGKQAGALALFAVIGSLGVVIPVMVFFVGGSRAGEVLAGWKEWLARNNSGLLTAVLLLLGAKHLGDAVGALLSL